MARRNTAQPNMHLLDVESDFINIDFWVRKMKHFHHQLDADGNGVVDRKDYDLIAQGFIDRGKLTGDKAERMREIFRTIYKVKWGDAPDGATPEQFLPICAKAFSTKEGREGTCNNAFLIFEAVDTNGDGLISLQEFTEWQAACNIDTSTAKQTFEALDLDGDGIMSKEEFQDANAGFFLSLDESSPTKHLFGYMSESS